MKNIVLYIAMLAVGLTSCTKIIDVDLADQTSTRLVVDGNVVHYLNAVDSGYQEIFLSKSRYYFDDVHSDNSVTGANVEVVNNQTGTKTIFQESTDVKGKYFTNDLIAKVGNGYTLNITATLDGEVQEFSGQDSIITEVPQVDRVFLEGELNFAGDSIYETTIEFINSPEQDYFKFEVFFNDTLIKNNHGGSNFFFSLIDDSFMGPGKQEFRVVDRNIEPKEEKPPFKLQVKMKRISFETYNYFRKLYANASSGDDTPQTEVRGVVGNLTYPDRYPLGTFSASSESQKSVIITDYSNN